MYSALVINPSAINREIAWIGLLQCSLNNEISQGEGDQYFGLLGMSKKCGAHLRVQLHIWDRQGDIMD